MANITRPGYILIDTKGEGASRYMIKNADTGEWEFFSNSYKDAIEALDRLVKYRAPYFTFKEAVEKGYYFYDMAVTSERPAKGENIVRVMTAKGSRKGELYILVKGSKTGKWYRRYLRKEDENERTRAI